jgi:DNA-binding MarR family transcriptional regulator
LAALTISDVERQDLAASFALIARQLADAERPLLDAHGLSMWAYIVLSQLARASVGTQLELAQAIGYDKTRLIARLDELEADGLVTREPDPSDRRARRVHLTAAGRARHGAARSDIRAMEDELLATLSAAERKLLLTVLPRLVAER